MNDMRLSGDDTAHVFLCGKTSSLRVEKKHMAGDTGDTWHVSPEEERTETLAFSVILTAL